jgi:hypothetical protein
VSLRDIHTFSLRKCLFKHSLLIGSFVFLLTFESALLVPIQCPYQMCDLQIFSSSRWLVFITLSIMFSEEDIKLLIFSFMARVTYK